MKKMILYLFSSVLLGSAVVGLSFSAGKAFASCDSNFFGIPSWCRGLGDSEGNFSKVLNQNNQDGIQQFIWTIVGNISDGIFRIIGVICVGCIIWAGYQYMISLGDVGKMTRAKMTLINALIGLVISVLASSIVNLVMGVF